MGSIIGDYIHFHQQNYINYGINRIHDKPSQKWNDAAQAFKEELKAGIQMQQLINQAKFLEDQYNNLFFSNEESNEFSQILQETIQQELNSRFLMAGKFNVKTLSVESTTLYSQLKLAIDSVRNRIGKIQLDKNMTLESFINKIDYINNQLLEQDEFKNIQQVQSRLQQAKKQLNDIKRIIDAKIKAGQGKTKISSIDNIQTITKIIQDFNRVPLLYDQSGDVFEWVLPFIQLKSSNLAREQLKKAMQELIKSSVVGQEQIQLVVPDILDDDITDFDLLTGNIKMKTISVRNKTDVQISYTKNDQLKTKKVSAKSVSGLHIKLADTTPLYRILLLSGNYEFATHYLNIISKSNQGGSATSAQIYQANRLIKGLILKLGAQGYDMNNPSELLIINDRSHRHIYVYNLKVLIYLIQKQLLQSGKYSNLIRGFDDNFSIDQNFQEEGTQTRIINIIRATQNIKLNVSLNKTALNEYKTLLNGFKI